jgi:hypothetical protein
MLFMVIERFADNDMRPVYRRVRERGRQLPEGLRYVDSWVQSDLSRCFQLMECDDVALLEEWTRNWDGCGVIFEEIVPVVSSIQAREKVERSL